MAFPFGYVGRCGLLPTRWARRRSDKHAYVCINAYTMLRKNLTPEVVGPPAASSPPLDGPCSQVRFEIVQGVAPTTGRT